MLPDVYGLETTSRARLRPMGVTIIATVWGLAGVVVTLGGVARLIAWMTGRLQLATGSLTQPNSYVLVGLILLLWVVIGLSILTMSIGLLHLHRWARLGCLILSGLSASIQLLSALTLALRGGIPAALPASGAGLTALAIIGYLLRSPIRAAFAHERQSVDTTSA